MKPPGAPTARAEIAVARLSGNSSACVRDCHITVQPRCLQKSVSGNLQQPQPHCWPDIPDSGQSVEAYTALLMTYSLV